MHQHSCYRNCVLRLTTLLLFSVVVRGQVAEPNGELRLYPRATQIGTVASRTFKDEQGREVKVIYYTGGGSFESPYREELLSEQSITQYEYDDHNCRIKSQRFDPGMKLRTTAQVLCVDGTATPSLSTVYDARGIRLTETRHTASGSTETVLYLDNTGDKVVAINGKLPIDTDLINGWGEAHGGFACGIAANRERGRQEDLQIYVSIKNISHEREGVVMISPVRVELKDSSGRGIERKPVYRNDESTTQVEGCSTYLGQGAPSVGRSQPQPGYSLGEQYDRLAPGKYTVTITYCVPGVPGRLVSNAIVVEVDSGKN